MERINIYPDVLISSMVEIPFFQGLSTEDICELARLCEVYKYDTGETLVQEGDPADRLFAVLEGALDIFGSGRQRKEIKLSTLSQGAIVGEASLFVKQNITTTVKTREPSVVLALSRSAFASYINTREKAGVQMLLYIVYGLLEKLRKSNADMVYEKECAVSAEDLEQLRNFFPSTIGEIFNDDADQIP